MDDRDRRIAELEAEIARLLAENITLRKRVEQLEQQVQKFLQRRKKTRSASDARRGEQDRRRKQFRKHPGSFRPEPPPGTVFIEHDVHPRECPHCGGHDLTATASSKTMRWRRFQSPSSNGIGIAVIPTVANIAKPPAKDAATWNCPAPTSGHALRLLVCYARVHLGISLGKTQHLLKDFFGLSASRAGLLGHLRWGGALFEPVVDKLWELLRNSPVVQGDETGWRIDGLPAWAWCFRDPRLALFLIDRHRNRAVLERALGTSFAGTLVSDFYAVYNRLDCRKQRCLVHLLRELHKLRETLPAASARAFIQPLITLFQDAIRLGHERKSLGKKAFNAARHEIQNRFDTLMLETARAASRMFANLAPAVQALRRIVHLPRRCECSGRQQRNRTRHPKPGGGEE